MLTNLISSQLSTKEITYKPGDVPAIFEVSVINQSEEFAAFQIEIKAAGIDGSEQERWYTVSPEVSTKNPPGDRTQFTVQIIDNPKPGFVGLMNLTVRIFSLELRQEDRKILQLILEPGTSLVPLNIYLPMHEFQEKPDTLLEIPVEVENPGYSTSEVVVRCTGIPANWLPEGSEQRLQIRSQDRAKTNFLCQIPSLSQAPSETYAWMIVANRPNEPITQVQGSLFVLPSGRIQVDSNPNQQHMPARYWLPNWKTQQAVFSLHFSNQSNCLQHIELVVEPEENQPPCQFEFVPDNVDLPMNQMAQLDVVVTRKRHWLGLPKTCLFKAKVQLLDDQIDVQNDTQLLRLILHPVLPLWLQGLLLVAFLALLWALSPLNSNNSWWEHNKPIKSVQFNGIGDRAISGASDKKVIGWQTSRFNNPLINHNTGTIAEVDKAVRVVRYRPVNNDVVAAGLENGEIQLWSLLPSYRNIQTLVNQPDDRVFDLVFTPDSRTLFSGHGSGLVVQWKLPLDLDSAQSTIQRQKQVGFAVNALKLVGDSGRYLAIAGRFNQLVVWDLKTDQIRPINKGASGESNYILSLAVPTHEPYTLASADNQGTIRIWNLRSCLTSDVDCEIVNEWQPDKTIYGLAFTVDGCYLVSGGQDGRTMLWELDAAGKPHNQTMNGIELSRSSSPINTVDVTRQRNDLLVIRGGDDSQVKIYRQRNTRLDCR